MTYRHCQLSVGRKFPANRPIRWENVDIVVPCDADGNEISVATPDEDMRLWCKQVVDYRIDENIFYAMLKGV